MVFPGVRGTLLSSDPIFSLRAELTAFPLQARAVPQELRNPASLVGMFPQTLQI